MNSESFIDKLAQSTEATAASKAAITTGATTAVLFGIDAQVVGICAGIFIGAVGLVYNIWSTERKLKLLKHHKPEDEWGT